MVNKFRIFDKQEKEYCEEPDYRWLLSRDGKLYNSENDKWYTLGERFIVEFSTGLFDLNKTEIFEGDKFNDDDNNDGGYYLIEYDLELSKFCVNLYSYTMYHNEGGGEEFDRDISLVDENVIDVSTFCDSIIIGNANE